MSQIVLTVGGNTAALSQSINAAVNRPWNIGQLNTSGFSQPLGKITGQASEFSKSLEAANARVIAFGASALAIALVKTALDGIIGSTVQVEASMVSINSVLGLTTSQLGKFSSDLFIAASQAGVSFKDAAAAAMEFSRQGLSAEETIRRTSSALVLARLSGMSFTSVVADITAAINSFNKEALTSEDVVNRMAAVDARFAVSAADLAEGIKRVGASASDANVTFNQMLALITSVQQSTARGGAVIGNAFKTIFTRMGRPEVLQQLESLGIQTRTATGEIRPLVDILKNLAQRYDHLGPSQRSLTAELLGGVYQINILKAAMRDLGQGTSVFDGALKAAGQSSGEANRRIEELNNTVSGKLTQTMNSFMGMSSKFGSLTIAPVMKSGLDFGKWAAENLSEKVDGDGIGAKIGEGLLRGIGNILSGPGVQIATLAILKLFGRLVGFGTVAAREFFQITTEASRLQAIEKSTSAFLSKQPDLLEEIRAGRLTIVDAARRYTHELASQNEATLVLKRNSLDLAKILQTPPRGIGGQPIFPQVRATMATVAHGWVPNFNIMQREEAEARSLGASSGVRAHTSRGTIGGKRFVMNNQETEIPNFGQNGDSAVIPHYAGGNLPDNKYRYHVLDRDFLTMYGNRNDFNKIIKHVTDSKLVEELVTGAAGVGKTTYIKSKYPNASFIESATEALRFNKDHDKVIVTRALANPFKQHNEKEFNAAGAITHITASSDVIKQFRTKRAEDENSPTAFGRKGYTHGPTSGTFLEAALNKYWKDKTTIKVTERSGNSFSMRDKTDEEKIRFQELQGVLAMNGAFTPYHIGHDELYQTILEHQAQDAAENPNAMLRKAVVSVARGEKRGSDVGLSVSEKIDLISRLHPEALVTSDITDTKPGFKAFEAGGKAYEFGVRKDGPARSTAIFGPDRLSAKGENESETAYQERTSFARQRLLEGWDVQPARRGNSRIAQATDIRAALSRQDSEGLGLEEAKKAIPPSIWHDLTYGSNLASLRNRSEYLKKARVKDKEFKTPSSTEWEKIGQSEGIDFSLEFPKQTYNEAAKHSLAPKTAEGAGQKLAESMSQEEAYAHVRSTYGASGLFSKNRETMLNPMHVDNKALRGIENKMSDKGGIDFALLGKAGFTFDEDKRTTVEKKSALGKLTYPPKISHALLAYHSDRVGQDFYDFNDAGMRVQYAVGRYNKEKGIAAGHPDLMKLVEANLGIATEGFAKQLNPNVSQEAILGAKENTKGFKSQIHSGAGAIFDAAFVAAFGIKSNKKKGEADFDVPAMNKRTLPKILSFFDLGGVSPNDITTGDFKSEVHTDGDARRSMAHKVLTDSTGMPASKALSQRQKEWAEMQAEARKTGQNRAAGYVPNFNFIKGRNTFQAKWMGERMKKDGAKESAPGFNDYIMSLAAKFRKKYEHNQGMLGFAGGLVPNFARGDVAKQRIKGLEFEDLFHKIIGKPKVKSGAPLDFPQGLLSGVDIPTRHAARINNKSAYGDLKYKLNTPSITHLMSKYLRYHSTPITKAEHFSNTGFSMLYKEGAADHKESAERPLKTLVAKNPSLLKQVSNPKMIDKRNGKLNERGRETRLSMDFFADRVLDTGFAPNFANITTLYRGVGGSRISEAEAKTPVGGFGLSLAEQKAIVFEKRKNRDGSTYIEKQFQKLRNTALYNGVSPSDLGRYLAVHQQGDGYGSGLLSTSYDAEEAADFAEKAYQTKNKTTEKGGYVGQHFIPTRRILNSAKIEKLIDRLGPVKAAQVILNSSSEKNAAKGRPHKFVGFDVNDIVKKFHKGGGSQLFFGEKEVALMANGFIPNFAREDSLQMFDPIYKDSKGKISVADSAGYFNPRNGRVAVSDSRKSFGNSFAHEEFGHGMFSKLSKTKGFSSRLGPLLEQAKSDPSILAALNKISPNYSSQVRSPMDLVDEAFAQSIGSKFGQVHSNDASARVLDKFTAPLITPRMMEHVSGYMGSNSAALYKRLAANKLPADKAIAGLHNDGYVPNFSEFSIRKGFRGNPGMTRTLSTTAGSYLKYHARESFDKKENGLYINYIESLSDKKGEGFKLFNKLGSIAKRSGMPILSGALDQQGDSQIFGQDATGDKSDNFAKVAKLFPQLRYRDQPDKFATSGTFITEGQYDSKRKFKSLQDLKDKINKMSLSSIEGMSFKDLATRALAHGHVPNFANVFNEESHLSSGGTLSRGNKATRDGLDGLLAHIGIPHNPEVWGKESLEATLSKKGEKLKLFKFLQSNPIEIGDYPESHKEIEDGNHRFALAKLAGIKNIPTMADGHVPNFSTRYTREYLAKLEQRYPTSADFRKELFAEKKKEIKEKGYEHDYEFARKWGPSFKGLSPKTYGSLSTKGLPSGNDFSFDEKSGEIKIEMLYNPDSSPSGARKLLKYFMARKKLYGDRLKGINAGHVVGERVPALLQKASNILNIPVHGKVADDFLEKIGPDNVSKFLKNAKRQDKSEFHYFRFSPETLSGGHIPNFNAIQDAVRREHAAGLPMSSIRVDRHPSLVSLHNPSGLGVWNTVQETGLSDGMSKARSAGINPTTKGMSRMAKGHVPNFADDSSGTIGGFGMSAFLGALAFMIPELSKFGSTLKTVTAALETAKKAREPFSHATEAAKRRIEDNESADTYSRRSLIAQAGPGYTNITGSERLRQREERRALVEVEAQRASAYRTTQSRQPIAIRRAAQRDFDQADNVIKSFQRGRIDRVSDLKGLQMARRAEAPSIAAERAATDAANLAQTKGDHRQKVMSGSFAASMGINAVAGFIPQETAAGKSMSMVAETFGNAAQVMSVIPGPLGIATAAITSIPGLIKAWESWSNKSPEMAAALDVMKSEFNTSGAALSEYSQAIGNLSQMYGDASVSTKTIIDTQNKVSKSLLSLTAMERGRINAQSTTEGRQRVAGVIQEEHKKTTGTSERALEFEKMDELKRTRWFRPGEQEQKSITQKEKELFGGEYASLGKKETDAVSAVRKKMPLLEDVSEQRAEQRSSGYAATPLAPITRQAIKGNALEVMAALLAQKAITQDVYTQHTKNLAVAERFTKELFTRNKLEERSLKNEKEIAAARTGDIQIIRDAKNAEQISEGKRDTAIYKVDSSVKSYVGNILQAATLADKLQSTKNSVNLQMGTDAVSLAGMRYGAGTQLRLGNEQKSQEVYTKLGEEKKTIYTEGANKTISSIMDNVLSKSDSKYKIAGGDVKINEDALEAKGELGKIMGEVSKQVDFRKGQGKPMDPKEILEHFKNVTEMMAPEGSLKQEILKGAGDTKLYELINELNTTMTRGVENAGAAAVSQLAIQNQAYKGQIAILDEQRKGKMFGAAPDSRKEERDAERQLRKDKRGYERGDRFATQRYAKGLTNMFGDSLPDEVVAPVQAQLAKGNAINRARQFGIVSAGNNATAAGLRKTVGYLGANNLQDLDLARARTVFKGENKNVTAQGIAKGAGLGDMSPLINSNAALAKSTESLEMAITRLSTTPFVFDSSGVKAANDALAASIKESNDVMEKIGEEIKTALEAKNRKDEIDDEKEKIKEENRKNGKDASGQPIVPANPGVPVASKNVEADSSNLSAMVSLLNDIKGVIRLDRGLPSETKTAIA